MSAFGGQPVLAAQAVNSAADTNDFATAAATEAGEVVAVLPASSKFRAAAAVFAMPLHVSHIHSDMHALLVGEKPSVIKKFRRICYRVQTSKIFVAFFTGAVRESQRINLSPASAASNWKKCAVLKGGLPVAIVHCMAVANAVLLGSVHHGMSKDFNDSLELGGQICASLFMVEFLIKIVALGGKRYFSDRFNCLDAFIVFTSSLEMFLTESTLDSLKITNTAKLLRVLRLLKLIHYITPLKDMVAAVIMSLGTLFWIVVLMVIVICVFALMGMQLFGGKFNFPDGTPRHNFDTFVQAFVTVWQVITATAWEEVLFDSVRSWEGSKWCYFYYLAVLVSQLAHLVVPYVTVRPHPIDAQNFYIPTLLKL